MSHGIQLLRSYANVPSPFHVGDRERLIVRSAFWTGSQAAKALALLREDGRQGWLSYHSNEYAQRIGGKWILVEVVPYPTYLIPLDPTAPKEALAKAEGSPSHPAPGAEERGA